jgi:hypothetical protein
MQRRELPVGSEFLSAVALPRRACTQIVYWVCDELNNSGFALPVLCLEKLAGSPVLRATPSLRAANLPRMELADGLNYGTADCALRCNVVATADRRPGTLSSELSNEPANSRLRRTIHQSQSKRKPKHIWLLTTAGFNIHTKRYVSSRTPLRL